VRAYIRDQSTSHHVSLYMISASFVYYIYVSICYLLMCLSVCAVSLFHGTDSYKHCTHRMVLQILQNLNIIGHDWRVGTLARSACRIQVSFPLLTWHVYLCGMMLTSTVGKDSGQHTWIGFCMCLQGLLESDRFASRWSLLSRPSSKLIQLRIQRLQGHSGASALVFLGNRHRNTHSCCR
jgi:hypothetical protein